MSNKVLLSVDVEDWYHGPTVISPKNTLKSLENFLMDAVDVERAFRYVDVCLELFDKNKTKATFFWVAEYARRFDYLIKRVASHGHEIACHGLCHYSKLDNNKFNVYNRTEFYKRTLQAKNILEDLTGTSVIGYRAPNAYISGMMIDVLEELEFQYDSSVSLNSLYNKTDSNLNGVDTSPYYPAIGGLDKGYKNRKIIEFPWPYLEMGKFKIQCAGGPFLRFFGSSLIKAGINQSLKRGHTTFYFHPIDICKDEIPINFDIKRPFLWIIKGDVVKKRIIKLLDNFAPISTNFTTLINENY